MLHVERAGNGPRIVLVHGFTQNARCWGRVADDLAVDHEVVRVDAPGHGGSSAVATDLVDGAALLGQAGGEGAYLGYSMGGRLALHLALARPDLVHQLILVGATAGIDDLEARTARRVDDEALAARLEAIGVDAFVDEWLAQPLFAGLDSTTDARDARRANTVAGMAASLRLAGTGAQQPLWSALATLAMPVLVVAGEHDERYRAVGERLVAAIGATASAVVVSGAGHACHLEAPDAFLAVVRPWLADHAS